MPYFNWDMPYASHREPVLARNVVATSQPLAAQAGLSMMRQGGNAIDAAVAAAMALTVVEPTSNGLGSDAFALVWAGGGLHGLNASGRSPAAMTPDRYEGMDEIPTLGWHGVTVPGAVSGWKALSERFGVLPFETLCEPAIHYARDGYHLTRQTAYYWRRAARAYSRIESWSRTFAPDGRAPRAGELVRLPDHASTLRTIGATGGGAFYQGELAAKIAAHAAATDGLITGQDLAAHEPEWVRPIEQEYHGFSLHEIPPNGQGLVALIALGILKYFRLDELEPDSAESLHLQIEAMKLAFADGRRYIADPAHMDVDVASLLDPAYLESRAKMIDRGRAGDPGHGEPMRGGTVYLTTADVDGNMVSYIQSNYTGFGSGIVVPGTGIALQNRGCCFTLEEGHPNQVGPNKLPYHTIIPGFVTRSPGADGGGEQGGGTSHSQSHPLMSFGVMGGFMQPQGHAQVMVRLVTYRQNPQAAIDAPRWRIDEGRKVAIEPGFDEKVYNDLRERGHELTLAPYPEQFYGRGQAAYRLDEHGYLAASDGRADGQAVGF